MATNYITKDYLITQLQNLVTKMATIYSKQEDVEFHVVDKYSDLKKPKVSTVCYIFKEETIGTDIYKKGFYSYNVKDTTPTWTFIETRWYK